VVLEFHIKLVEVAAPTPYTDDEIGVVFRMLLCIEKSVAVDGVELGLMTAELYECLNKRSHLFNAYIIAKHRVVDLNGKRTTVDDVGQIILGEGLDN